MVKNSFLALAKKYQPKMFEMPVTAEEERLYSDPRVENLWQNFLKEKGLQSRELTRVEFLTLSLQFVFILQAQGKDK